MSLRIVGDFIELDCERVARLLPNLRPTLVYRLTALFDALAEDDAYIRELEERIAALKEREARLKPVKAE
jgi:hypothetical protein